MKKTITLLANLFLSSALLWGVPTVNAEEGALSVPVDTSMYCHMKFPPIRENTPSWDRPVLNENAGNIIDFYGPCDHDPLGAEEIRVQRQMLHDGVFGDTESSDKARRLASGEEFPPVMRRSQYLGERLAAEARNKFDMSSYSEYGGRACDGLLMKSSLRGRFTKRDRSFGRSRSMEASRSAMSNEAAMNGQQEFGSRVARVRRSMRENGLRVLLVYGSGRHDFLRLNYVTYLTDFISVGPETILLLPLEEAPVLYLSPAWDIPRAREKSWVSDVRPFKEFWSRSANLSGKIGLVGREAMHAGLHDEIVAALSRRPVDAKEIIENLARCKSAFELERMRRAATIADAGVQALHEDACAGLKEFELAAIVEYRMRSLGAEDNFGMVVANSHNQALHPPTDRVVQPGDIIIGEITPCVGGLFVQICRTMVLGEPAPVVREKYSILKQAMRLGMDAAKTGASASAVAAAINARLCDAGYEKYCRPPFMRVRGHGLGCGSSAPGNLEEENQTGLEEGMTFIIHPNQYLPETGYMTLGDTVVMTSSKADALTHSSWDLYVKE